MIAVPIFLMPLAAFRTGCARDPQHADEKTLGTWKKNKRHAAEECGPARYADPERKKRVEVDEKDQGQEQMADHNEGEPGSGVVGANGTEVRAAGGTALNLFEVALKQRRAPAT